MRIYGHNMEADHPYVVDFRDLSIRNEEFFLPFLTSLFTTGWYPHVPRAKNQALIRKNDEGLTLEISEENAAGITQKPADEDDHRITHVVYV